MSWLIIACLTSSALVSGVGTALLRRYAPRWGLVDRPNARKLHQRPMPLGGGIAIWLGIMLPFGAGLALMWWIGQQSTRPAWVPQDLAVHFAGIQFRSVQLWAILLGGTVIAAMGLIDDLKTLGWKPKLCVQFAVACGLVASGVQATVFIAAPWVGWILTVVWIVVLTNAFNFLDNMDGLSAGIAIIAAVLFAVIMLVSTSEPRWFVAAFLLILAGSTAGFLAHNWPPARIFMGDTGSCLIGLLLACLTVVGTFYDDGKTGRHVLFAPLCILAVPLYDFSSVVLIRLLQGRSPFHADKSHFSHRLVEMGLSRRSAVLTIHLVTLTTGIGGLLLFQVRGWIGASLILTLIGCLLFLIAILESAGRGKGDS